MKYKYLQILAGLILVTIAIIFIIAYGADDLTLAQQRNLVTANIARQIAISTRNEIEIDQRALEQIIAEVAENLGYKIESGHQLNGASKEIGRIAISDKQIIVWNSQDHNGYSIDRSGTITRLPDQPQADVAIRFGFGG